MELLGLVMAYSGGLEGILAGRTKSTDDRSSSEQHRSRCIRVSIRCCLGILKCSRGMLVHNSVVWTRGAPINHRKVAEANI